MDLDTALTGKSAEPAGATRILRDDHDEVRRLIAEYRNAARDFVHARHVIVEAMSMQVELHARIEDEVFYPAVEGLCADFVARAREEHRAVAGRLAALEALDPADAQYADLADEVIDMLVNHMDGEEHSLFPRVERDMGGELRELGAQLIRRKEALTRSVEDMEGPAT